MKQLKGKLNTFIEFKGYTNTAGIYTEVVDEPIAARIVSTKTTQDSHYVYEVTFEDVSFWISEGDVLKYLTKEANPEYYL